MNYLSTNTQNALNQLGFSTPQDIANAGVVRVFLLLKEMGLTPTKSVLWRLDAYARGVSLADIDDARKKFLSGCLKNHPPVAIFP
ncbi:MAG: TfoX/Sxy family DNA transformation protein, partial [Neisseriaceae bacterium]|nr:TfoX/Sxy family DNA transformation protein [Neisseriaceae bacterium]